MYCEKCNNFFQPPPEEEKLITTGGLPVLCPDCERARWQAKDPPTVGIPVYPGMEPVVGIGIELYRAARFNADGVEMMFVAVPNKPRKPDRSPLRKARQNETGSHVFVMTERTGQLRNAPRVQLHTNLETFQKYKSSLKIAKIPSFWDPLTGVGEIEIPAGSITKIEKTAGVVRVDLKDGGWVNLYYR